MAFNNPKIKNPLPVTVGTQTVGTVIIGPILVDSGLLQGMLSMNSKTGTTTPTACTIQISLDDAGTASTFGNLPSSVTITSATTASTITNVLIPETVCRWVRVISGAAYGAGTSTLEFLGIEK